MTCCCTESDSDTGSDTMRPPTIPGQVHGHRTSSVDRRSTCRPRAARQLMQRRRGCPVERLLERRVLDPVPAALLDMVGAIERVGLSLLRLRDEQRITEPVRLSTTLRAHHARLVEHQPASHLRGERPRLTEQRTTRSLIPNRPLQLAVDLHLRPPFCFSTFAIHSTSAVRCASDSDSPTFSAAARNLAFDDSLTRTRITADLASPSGNLGRPPLPSAMRAVWHRNSTGD